MAGLFDNCKVTIIDNSPEVLSALEAAKKVALEACGLQAEGYAKMLCPVDTGRLRDSITHATDGDNEYIGTNVEYAPYVEYGTSRTQAQPFLKPAAEDHVEEYQRIFETYLKGTIGG